MRFNFLKLLIRAWAATHYLGVALARFLNFLSFHSLGAWLYQNFRITGKLNCGSKPIFIADLFHILDIFSCKLLASRGPLAPGGQLPYLAQIRISNR